MSNITLKAFGGMVPRRGEQHLDTNHATDAENANLYSGELRPLNKPSLAHEFCKPDQPCFVSPKPIVPPIVRPPIPEDCIPPVIIQQPEDVGGEGGTPCLEYDCAAYENYLEAVPTLVNAVAVTTEVAELPYTFSTAGGDGKLRAYLEYVAAPQLVDHWLGTDADTAFGISTAQHLDAPSWCGGSGVATQMGSIYPGPSYFAIVGPGDEWGNPFMSAGITGFQGGSHISATLLQKLGKSWSFYHGGGWHNSSGYGSIGAAVATDGNGDLILSVYINNANILGYPDVSDSINLGPCSDKVGQVAVSITSGSPFAAPSMDTNPGNTAAVSATVVASYEGQSLSVSNTYILSGTDYANPPEELSQVSEGTTTLYTTARAMSPAHLDFTNLALGSGDAEVLQRTQLEFDRNFEDYIDPDPTCGQDIVLPGTSVTFSVGVNPEATTPLQYQWYKNGAPMDSETSPILTFVVTAEDDGAQITVLVIGPCGEDMSQTAILLVDTDVELPPECLPYDCEAYMAYIENSGIGNIARMYSTDGEGDPPYPFHEGLPDQDNRCRYYHEYIAAPQLVTGYGSVRSSPVALSDGSFAGAATPDFCGGTFKNLLCTADAYSYGPDALLFPTDTGLWGSPFVEALVIGYNGGSDIRFPVLAGINKRWTCKYNNSTGKVLDLSQSVGAHLYTQSGTNDVRLSAYIAGLAGYFPGAEGSVIVPDVANELHKIHVWIQSGSPQQVETPLYPGGWDIATWVTIHAVYAGVSLTVSGWASLGATSTIGKLQFSDVAAVGNTLYTQARMFYRDHAVSLASLWTGNTEIDLTGESDLYLDRNYMGYTPPGYCPIM